MNIKDLQLMLNNLGVKNAIDNKPLVIDGVSGAKTLSAKAKAKEILKEVELKLGVNLEGKNPK